ncbi:MAG: LptF/LptG family permease [Deltaproteobacteria bacterium]|nr:LptF/LptG family permease [Deltaproteobacteria bacterium]MBW1871662.1 LptF/LptG family permease [Deltaproteobacteria bacterium]
MNRMLLRLLLRSLLVSLGVLLVLTLVMDFFESARHLLSGKGTVFDVVLFSLCRVPDLLVLLLPIALVVSTCVTFAVLGRDLELRALAAAGIGPQKIVRPLLGVAAATVISTILIAEFLVPPALNQIEKLMTEKFGRFDSTWQFFRNHHWYQGQAGRIFQVTGKSSDGEQIRLATALTLNEDFHIIRRTDVRKATWQGDHWVGGRVTLREFENGEMRSLQRHKNFRLDWSESPERFEDLRGRPKQKTFRELFRTVEQMEQRGFLACEYRLEINNRVAFPFLSFCLVLFAFPWIYVPARRRSLAAALTEALGLVFGAYFLVSMATSIVSGGLLAAWVGAWAPSILILCLATPKWVQLLRGRT